MQNTNEPPLVSVVVPTRNSEKYLQKCLLSIRGQTYKNLEIIVVDNHSADKTKEIAERYADLVLTKGPERCAQLNFGIRHARGKYVYRVDSDFFVKAPVIESAVTKCEREGFDAICIHNASDPSASFWAKVRKIERDCYRYDDLNVAARFFRKDVFERVGGFDEDLVAGEDYDLHNRLLKHGFKIGYIEPEEVHLGEPESLAEIAKKHYYYGKTITKFLGKNEMRGFKQINPVRPAFIRNWVGLAEDPALFFGFAVYQYVKYFSGGLGFVLASLDSRKHHFRKEPTRW
ncbi:MAG: glycosyltransferase [Candidatus Verstraetearchaeota archaeon]|nr:glycosyltransferase [Candidatus Verstraetearchaeota archaeon]